VSTEDLPYFPVKHVCCIQWMLKLLLYRSAVQSFIFKDHYVWTS